MRRRPFRVLLVIGLLSAVLNPQPILAQGHVVSPEELRNALLTAKRTRESNRAAVTSLFTSPQAEKAFRSANLDANTVRAAVSALSDDELARIASRAERLQADVVAGRLSDRDLLLIILGLAALILIIVAVS